ncbi:Cna B-type domain-containing protein [uncultured Helcococcus sp.]|uniref:Cna B-type domain-containing protein n=1 Tax=uncultured Helcococcus sp. TaxID=1072508 RepID=UPI00260C7B56|nr:Cna B-type domain-containing protein [uncultured Helcococcus sp.]
MLGRRKKIYSLILAMLLLVSHLSPVYGQALDKNISEASNVQTDENIVNNEYELNIVDGILYGFVKGKEPNEAINLVIPSEVKKIEKRAFYNSKMIKSVDFSNTNDLYIDDHAFQNASLKGELNISGVSNIGKYAFADNEITNIKNSNLESIGEYAFRQNNISNLDLNVENVDNFAFEENQITKVNITSEQAPLLGKAIFQSNPLTELTLNTPDFDISEDLFLGLSKQVSVKFDNTNQTSKDKSSYLVNPIDIKINYIKNEDKSNIGSRTELVERDASPYEIAEPILEGYKLLPSEDYTLEDGEILFSKTQIDLLFEENYDPEIRFSSKKQSLYFAGAEISTEDILSDVYIKKTNGKVVPAFDENGQVLEGLTFEPNPLDKNVSKQLVKFTYTENGKTVLNEFTFSRSQTDIMKQEIGNGWRYEDFKYDRDALVGFSDIGIAKLNNGNRDLVLPGINPLNGQAIKSIRNSAFTKKDINYVDFSRLIDLEVIGANSFSGNNIKSINFANATSLKIIEARAFENNELLSIDLSNTKIESIKNAAFANNLIENFKLNKVTIRDILSEAFSDNKIKEIIFNGENGDYANLEKIDGKTFSSNPLKSFILRDLPKLEGEIYVYSRLDNLELENLPLVKVINRHKTFDSVYADIKNIKIDNLESLAEIGNCAFDYHDKYSGERNISISNLPNLEVIGQEAFANNYQNEMFIINAPKLQTIKESAFRNNLISELDLTKFPNLKSIGSLSFSKGSFDIKVPYTSINISGLKNLEEIGYRAFDSGVIIDRYKKDIDSLNLVDLPKLKSIGNGAFNGLNIKDLTIKNIPELETLQGFGHNKLEKLVIKDLPKVKYLGGFKGNTIESLEINLESLEEIGERAFESYNSIESKFTEKFDIRAPKLRKIGKYAFESIRREEIDLSKFTSLEEIGQNAFVKDYPYDSKLKNIIFPETDKAIAIHNKAFNLISSEKDFSDQKNIKLRPLAHKFISASLINSIILDSSKNLQVNYDDPNFNKNFPVNDPVVFYIKNNDVDGDGIADITSKDGLLINPQTITIKPYYIGEDGNKHYFKEREYILTSNREIEPPIISGFKNKIDKIDPEYTNLTFNENKVIEVEYERILATDTVNVDFKIEKLNKEDEFFNLRYYSSNEAKYQITINNSGQNEDSDLRDIIVDIQLPDHFDPDLIDIPNINNVKGLEILNIDPVEGTIKLKIDKLDRASSIKIPGIFKFLPYETPQDFEGNVKAKISFTYKDDRKILTSETTNYKAKYEEPIFYKKALDHISLSTSIAEDLEIKYKFDIEKVYRKLEQYTIYDKLPTYTAVEDGKEVTRIAKFDPDKNPGWVVIEENEGIPTKIKYTLDSLDFIDYKQFNYTKHGSAMKFPELLLDFPNAKADQSITNSSDFKGNILKPEFDDKDFDKHAHVSTKLKYNPIENPSEFKKRVNKELIPLYPGKEKEIIVWDIDYKNESFVKLSDGSMDENSEIKAENIVINDYIYFYSYPNMYEQYYSVIPGRDASISLIKDTSTSKKDYSDKDILLKKEVKAGEEFLIPKDMADKVKLIQVNYKDVSLAYGESLNTQIRTITKDYDEKMSSYRDDFNYAEMFYDTVKYENSNPSKGTKQNSLTLKDSAKVRFETQKLSSNVYKEQKKSGYNVSNNQVIDYKIGSRLYNNNYNKLISRYPVKDFKQVDILPAYLNILSIEMSDEFKDFSGQYKIEALEDGRTKITFSTSYFNMPVDRNVDIAHIQVEVLPEAPNNIKIINGTYNDFSNKELERRDTRKISLENDKELSYKEVSFELLRPQKSGAYKYIRKTGENWTKSLFTQPGEKIQYVLSINELNTVNRKDISILDIFPYTDDITIVENQAGLRDPRESQFSNIYKGIDSIQYIDSNGKAWDYTDKFEVLYINDLKDYPTTISDGRIDEWAVAKAERVQKENPVGIVINSKEGIELEAPYNLKVIINMEVPGRDVFPLDKYDEWENRAALNSFARKDDSIDRYIETNPVINTLVAPSRDIYFKKIDENGKPLANSKFILKMEDHKDKFAYSDHEGNIIFRDIPFKEFTVHEVNPTSGYKLNFEKYFNDGSQSDEKEALHTFKNERQPDPGKPEYKVVINKKDHDGKALANVRFELTSFVDGKTYIKDTDKNGRIEFTGLYKGSYKLSEIRTVNNLQAIEDIFFEINEEDDENKDKTFTFDLVNDKYKVNLYKIGMYHYDKIEEDTDLYTSSGKPLSGVQFNLYEYNGGDKKLVSKKITDEKGLIQFTGLSGNVIYALEETSTSNAYVKNEDLILFKIGDKGKVYRLLANGDNTYTEVPYKEDGIVVANYPARKLSSVEVTKTDEFAERLQGAEFTLYKEENGIYTEYAKAETGENGIARFENLPYGGYRLIESKAPVGYSASNAVKTFVLDGKEAKTLNFDYVNKETKLRIIKVEKLAGAFSTEEEALDYKNQLGDDKGVFIKNNTVYRSLTGAMFELWDGDNVIKPLSTDENGYTVYGYNKLDVDKTYTLKEIKAPEGYNQAREITIKGSEFNKNSEKEILLENKKQSGELKIYKYSEEKGVTLEGVTFALFGSEEDAKTNKNALYTTDKTNSNGYTILKDIAYGTYYLKEIDSPLGYKVSDEIRKIEINEQTTSITVSFYNETTTKELLILKKDSTGKALKGAKFELYRKADDIYTKDTLVATAISDENGHIKFEGLPVSGKYYIKEVSAPDGYLAFEGKVDIDDLLNNDYKDENQITVINKKLMNLEVKKDWKDSKGEILEAPVDKISVQLYRNDEKIGEPISLESSNNWTYKFENLESHNPETFEEYKYSVKEIYEDKEVEAGTWIKFGNYNFVNSYSEISEGTITITNTREDLIEIEGSKTWDDKNNQDGIRPNLIKVNLLANGEIVETKEVTAEDNWTWKFTGLAKYAKGEEIKYTISEEPVKGYETTVDGFNVTNTHKTETIEIEGSKTWEDKDNQDGKRPESIKINLLANGEVVETKEISAKDKWTWKFTALPKYASGQVIEYTITEDPVEGYETTVDGFNLTNTHKPETIEIEGSKTWDDNNDQDRIRPESITITLLGNGKKVVEREISIKDNWSWKFVDLPKYAEGKEIEYTIAENKVDGYESKIDKFNVTNTHKPETIEIEGSKTWNDKDNQDGIRPKSITINLLINGELVETKEVTAKDNWTWKFTGLAKYAEGEEIKYTITEEPVEGYETTVDGFNVTNTHKPEIIEIEGSKTWDDKDNQDGIRPESITIKLLANGEIIETKEVSAKDNWTWKFTELAKYADGEEIKYTITENSVKGYSTLYKDFDIVNEYTPEKTSITVLKNWDDNNNQDGIRPKSLIIKLLADGKDTGKTLELSQNNNWKDSFTELDVYKDGKEILYTIEEEKVSGYDIIKITGNLSEGFVITNTHMPETIEIEGSKIWEDNNNQDGTRPNSIKINLYANDEFVESKEVTSKDRWAWKFTKLPKYAEGKEVKYTITEDPVDKYETEIDGFNIKNIHVPETIEIKGSKTWNDNNNQDGIRPESITINLLANGELVETKEVSVKDNWTWKFTGLAKYAKGEEIKYTISEEPVKGYETTIDEFNITNTHIPETIEIEGSKTWDDKENQDGIRPDSITINLLANDEIVETKKVTELDKWSWKFTNLAKYAQGKEIKYTVTEEPVEGYETTIDGFNITNTHRPETIEIEGSKTWDDKDNQDGIRPNSITINLLANGEIVETKEVTAKENWSWKFTSFAKYAEGKEIEYTISENKVDGYETKVDGFNLINTYLPKDKEKPKAPKTGDDMVLSLYLGSLVVGFIVLYYINKKVIE